MQTVLFVMLTVAIYSCGKSKKDDETSNKKVV